MKKVLLSAVALFAFGFANAQGDPASGAAQGGGGDFGGWAKGDVFLSGSVGYRGESTGDAKFNQFAVMPRVGFFVSDNIAIGGMIGYEGTTNERIIDLIAFTANSQVFRVGIKAGPNFSNFSGGASELNYDGRTSMHAGAVAEIGLTSRLALMPELLYSSQGADVDGIGDFNLDYVSVPVLAKIYILQDKLSIDVGPQFSFLIDEAEESFENESFDFAVAGGLTLNISKSLFVQGRYTAGLTEVSRNAQVKNTVVQLSVGYMIF